MKDPHDYSVIAEQLYSSPPLRQLAADDVPGALPAAEPNDLPAMPPDQAAAWELTHAFRADYFRQHRRTPRQGLVMKKHDKHLAAVRAEGQS